MDAYGRSKVEQPINGERPTVPGGCHSRDAWGNLAARWGRIHTALVIGSIFLSALVASGSALLNEKARSAAAILAAVCTGVLASLNPQKQSEEFWEAWRMLNVAKLEFCIRPVKATAFKSRRL